MSEQIVSKWSDRISTVTEPRGLRVGWIIRLRNGKLARITWVADNGESYMAKVIETILDAKASGQASAHLWALSHAGKDLSAPMSAEDAPLAKIVRDGGAITLAEGQLIAE